MNTKAVTALGAVVACSAAVAGVAHAASRGGATSSRLDDGRQYGSQAKVTEQQAIAAARTRASGALNEVDLERRDGRLVFNVDVGVSDVKVDAATGEVVAVDRADD